MNLNEAAEIVRQGEDDGVTEDTILAYMKAGELLKNTMLAELDPTPISEEWLRESGWIEEPRFGVYLRGNFTACKTRVGWSIGGPNHTLKLKTLGELRTLLRLMGGGE